MKSDGKKITFPHPNVLTDRAIHREYSLPDIHDIAGWDRWAKEQEARALIAARRHNFLWE